MRTSDILVMLSALTTGGLACASKPAAEATEVPVAASRGGVEASCRHELGRCGGHKPGDGACGGVSADGAEPAKDTPTPLSDVVVAPGKFAEINLEMPEGSTVVITFQATGGPLEWNVHSHEGDKAVVHAEGTGEAGELRFTAPRSGPFSYLWKNAGATPVRLTARLASEGSARVHSVHPAP